MTEFGTLDTQVQNAASNAAAGLGHAMLELRMRDVMPAPGKIDRSALDAVESRFGALVDAGLDVTLGLGLHFAPDWLSGPEFATMGDQSGQLSPLPDFVWNARTRGVGQRYVDALSAAISFDRLWAVRATSGFRSEVLYPNSLSGGYGYWAYGPAANSARLLAAGQTLNPLPDPDGRGGAPREIKAQFLDWYLRSLANTVVWQRDALAARGFTGSVEVICPGRGVQQRIVESDIATTLPGSSVTSVGAVWDRLFAALVEQEDPQQFVVYCSSAPDGSGADVGPQLDDIAVALTDPVVESWSAARWLCRIARQPDPSRPGLSLRYRQENPGYFAGDRFSARYLDRGPEGMVATVHRMLSTGLVEVHYWAHDATIRAMGLDVSQ